MARIRLNLRNPSVTAKIAKARQIVTAMTNNASFPNPHPSLSDVTAAADELEKAYGLTKGDLQIDFDPGRAYKSANSKGLITNVIIDVGKEAKANLL